MDKSSDDPRGGFGMRKHPDDRGSRGPALEDINSYLDLEKGSETYHLLYAGGAVKEEVAEVSITDRVRVELSGEGSNDSDYQLFLEEAGFYLEEQGEIENPYRLLDEV